MIAILLAAVAGTVTVATGPFTPETACDEHELQVILSAQPKPNSHLKMNVDRRMADVLLEERRLEAEATPGKNAWVTAIALPAGVTLLGLCVVLYAAGKRSRGLAAAGALCCTVAGVLALRPVQQDRLARIRIDEVRSCRLHLIETRAGLEHGEYSACLHDIAEADEDLLKWKAQITSNMPVTVEDVTKLRKELTHME
ncbi:MAG: hypothetical protein EXR72_23430 [Myxococcales bacterium]|nr:hypothetical protein [Myxococcales bacterium]